MTTKIPIDPYTVRIGCIGSYNSLNILANPDNHITWRIDEVIRLTGSKTHSDTELTLVNSLLTTNGRCILANQKTLKARTHKHKFLFRRFNDLSDFVVMLQKYSHIEKANPKIRSEVMISGDE